MRKKIFILIVFLMSISLIGIVTVQVYWIGNVVEAKRKQFKNDVKIALALATERVNEEEYQEFKRKISPFIEGKENINSKELRKYFLEQIDTTGKQKTSLSWTLLEENIDIPAEFLGNDSVLGLTLKRITGRQDYFQTKKNINSIDFSNDNTEKSITQIRRFPEYEETIIKDVLQKFNLLIPLHKRISNRRLNVILSEEFAKRGIDIDYKYGVYGADGFLTNLKSGYFTVDRSNSISYPLFKNDDKEGNFTIYVTFPNQKKHILSDISTILLLSIFFILIIIIAFSSSLYQLIRQKKISEIKTDFINNMTHEFKTPIATINLALDSIKNPKILENKEKVLRYVSMIRQENKRMHGHVENVLRISKLEKNQLEIPKEAVDMDDIIDEAITHVSLLANDKNAKIKTHFEALQTEVLGNFTHLTNVLVNMLENAIKYSYEKPHIDIFTETTLKYFICKIQDDGIGMSKSAQKSIFEKFYREQKGDIHNVKGHGLGLAYVKKIIENHGGTIFVESEKGKGSIFTIKLPLI